MERVDPDEQVIATIYRHLFGLVAIYIQVAVGLIAASALLFFILPNFVTQEDNPQVFTWLAVVLLLVAGFMVIILLIASIIYRRNKLIITTKSITQVAQAGLFNRRVSQLAISNIEDATALRKGIFQTALNYGILNVETAGEQNNFHFDFCPQPDLYAKYILEAREKFVERFEYDVGPNSARRYQQQEYHQAGQPYRQQYTQQPRPSYPDPEFRPTPQQSPSQVEYQNQDQDQDSQYDHQTLPPTRQPNTENVEPENPSTRTP